MAKKNQVAGGIKVLIWPGNRKVILGSLGGHSIIPRVLKNGTRELEECQGQREMWNTEQKETTFLALKMEGGAMTQGLGVASENQKKQENRVFPRASRF